MRVALLSTMSGKPKYVTSFFDNCQSKSEVDVIGGDTRVAHAHTVRA